MQNVPDMTTSPATEAADDGCQTFYYTNQQSARLMFYHDHAWGITRLNVYAGEAAGYLITDDTEQALDRTSGTIPDAGIRHASRWSSRTGPSCPTRARSSPPQDPTWDVTRWGGHGQPLVPPRLHAGAEPG